MGPNYLGSGKRIFRSAWDTLRKIIENIS
jgi:hypothetical protein